MPRIRYTQRFKRKYARLSAAIQAKIDKQIALLAENPRHPSLRSKPIQGLVGIYEARIDQDYRLTYQRLPGGILLLRVVASHEDALKKP